MQHTPQRAAPRRAHPAVTLAGLPFCCARAPQHIPHNAQQHCFFAHALYKTQHLAAACGDDAAATAAAAAEAMATAAHDAAAQSKPVQHQRQQQPTQHCSHKTCCTQHTTQCLTDCASGRRLRCEQAPSSSRGRPSERTVGGGDGGGGRSVSDPSVGMPLHHVHWLETIATIASISTQCHVVANATL